jgi:hypothetical protein
VSTASLRPLGEAGCRQLAKPARLTEGNDSSESRRVRDDHRQSVRVWWVGQAQSPPGGEADATRAATASECPSRPEPGRRRAPRYESLGPATALGRFSSLRPTEDLLRVCSFGPAPPRLGHAAILDRPGRGARSGGDKLAFWVTQRARRVRMRGDQQKNARARHQPGSLRCGGGRPPPVSVARAPAQSRPFLD